jgi:hypothetical protein
MDMLRFVFTGLAVLAVLLSTACSSTNVTATNLPTRDASSSPVNPGTGATDDRMIANPGTNPTDDRM